MSTTRSQKRRNNLQDSSESNIETATSPVLVGYVETNDQDFSIAGPSAKSPRVENSTLERLSTSLKEEITSEIRNLLGESQKEILKLLKIKPNEQIREQEENTLGIEPKKFYTPTRSFRISSTLNDDASVSYNT